MEKEITIGVSARHVHLTEEIYNVLFDEPIEKDFNLNQNGEFASKQRLSIVVGDKEIANVRILGPFRQYNQVEISKKDAMKLGVNPPVRASGNLDGALPVVLKTPKGSVNVTGCILAQRHVHMTPKEAEELNVVDGQKVMVKVDGDRSGIMDAYIKISDNGYFEMHVDTDDANAFLLGKEGKGILII